MMPRAFFRQVLAMLTVGLIHCSSVAQVQTYSVTGTIDLINASQEVASGDTVYGAVYLHAPTGLHADCNTSVLGEKLAIASTLTSDSFNALVMMLLSFQSRGEQATFTYSIIETTVGTPWGNVTVKHCELAAVKVTAV